ncbi:MAG: nucleotide sugar dehydrogenase [Candidatus Methanomethylicia archaeon]
MATKYSKVAVIGLGHVGLPVAVVFASKGLQVVGIDTDKEKIEMINKCECYIREPGLTSLLKNVICSNLFKVTSDYNIIKECDAIIVTVQTPLKDHSVDFSFLKNALEKIRLELSRGKLIVIESTIPVGTINKFVKPFLEESGLKIEEDIYLAYVPERLSPGNAINELLTMPRIIGGAGSKSSEEAFKLYSRVNPNLIVTDATTAEFVKLIENTFRDLNIAYANLLALISEKIGVDVDEAIRLANTHSRVFIHKPGAGVGGPCLTKDPYVLYEICRNIPGSEMIALARSLNDYMPTHIVKIIIELLEKSGLKLDKAKVAILGVAYKGGVDDIRSSPAKTIIDMITERGINVVVFDPYTEETFNAAKALSIEDAVKGSDVLVIVTDHPEFKELNLAKIYSLMRNPIIVDGRRILDPYIVIKHGFKYYGVGFGKIL